MPDYKYAISFVDSEDGKIIHCVCMEELPNIATLKEIFDEIMFDDEFGFFNRPYVNSLSVNIVDYKPFADEFPDWVPSGD